MTPYSPQTRDAGLRKLTRIRRWLIAGTVAMTGVFTAIAANAFPGKTVGLSGGQPSSKESEVPASAASASATQSSERSSNSLSPAAQAPQSAEPSESAPLENSEPAQTATEAPVVSGGS